MGVFDFMSGKNEEPGKFYTDYRCPPPGDPRVIHWVNEAIQAGEQYLKLSTHHKEIKENREILMGMLKEKMPKSLARIKVNRPKRQVREIVATLSNLRARFEYKTDNKRWYNQSKMLNQMAMSWWMTSFSDRDVKAGLQFASTDGVGYLGPHWDNDYWTRGRGDIRLAVYEADAVLPFHIGSDHDLQKSYASTIRRSQPLAHVHAVYADSPRIGEVREDSGEAFGVQAGHAAVSRYQAPVLNRFGPGAKRLSEAASPWPMVTVRHTYVQDFTVNRGERPRIMAQGKAWQYTVPYVGQKIFDGYNRDGSERTREATPRDCYLYPQRRLIVSTENVILEDGPAPFWHGMVPAIPVYFDKWPWDFLPYGLVADTAGLALQNNSHLRTIQDSMAVRLNPPLMFDETAVSATLMQNLNLRIPGLRLPIDMTLGDAVKPILDPSFYDVPNWVPQQIKDNEERSDYLLGVNDYNALAKAQQIPSGDTIEALMNAVGPLVQDEARELEVSIRALGEQWKGLAMQFYTKSRRVTMLGKDNVTETEFDFDPNLLIPSHMEGEKTEGDAKSPQDAESDAAVKPLIPSKHSLTERARKHISTFYMHVTPNSLHNLTQMSRKLMYLQLFRSGFPIDPWTVADQMDIGGFGAPPEGTSTIFERWRFWKKLQNEDMLAQQARMMEFQAQVQAQLQAAGVQGGGGINPGAAPGGGGAQPPAGNASGNPGQAGAGRPPSGQKAPQLEAKDGGTRPTISESG